MNNIIIATPGRGIGSKMIRIIAIITIISVLYPSRESPEGVSRKYRIEPVRTANKNHRF
jgi:hypothetical protein